ncbi:DNA polymerase IV [Mariprofundus micogutta]|uniref:DNA polymerase IV n=1 Tax=Mariprofundus micogutta TaxID=1921010 RepID=A0A1L8CJX6_9PROT|nr:DNA polymerase IV [Mariprofundus micogutta]GAV19206.1 DNA polymerase IV [Mariprofundus micogutta]
MSNWSNAIAHVDCDAFYASCEAARRPDLKGRPICVLSSQNAIVVAKSYDAKALGITTGMPVWEAKKLSPQVVCLAADFRYYGQVSNKVFSILRRYSPDVEIYSIDEAFLDMNGMRSLWRKSFQQIADDIRVSIFRETGVTVSVGISNTRTLAKLASESNKPNGTAVLPGQRIELFLSDLPVAAIPGIGRNRAALLQKFKIHTALQFAHLEDTLMHRLLGRHGMLLKHELSGRSVLPLELKQVVPKSIARTASMGQLSHDRRLIAAHLSYHGMRLVAELVAKQLLARRLSVFLTLASFERQGTSVQLDFSTSSLKRIMAAVKVCFQQLFRPGEQYRGCGVVATDISREVSRTDDLFGFSREDTRQTSLMLTVNHINKKYGDRTVSLASVGQVKKKRQAPRFHYPLFIAH